MNITAAIFFAREIDAFAQSAYAFLAIPTLPADFWDGPLIVIGFVVAIFAKDFCDYILHRAMHTSWGWPAHAAHHTDTHVNGFTAFRVHFIEPQMMSINYLFVLTWLQLPHLIPLMVLLVLVHNIYVHLDLDWDHGRFRYLVASPVFHRWHHADVPEAYGKNLANIIPLYDVIFGTYYEAGPCREQMGALKAGLSDKNPLLIWIYPFQAWGSMILEGLRRLSRAVYPRDRSMTEKTGLPPADNPLQMCSARP